MPMSLFGMVIFFSIVTIFWFFIRMVSALFTGHSVTFDSVGIVDQISFLHLGRITKKDISSIYVARFNSRFDFLVIQLNSHPSCYDKETFFKKLVILLYEVVFGKTLLIPLIYFNESPVHLSLFLERYMERVLGVTKSNSESVLQAEKTSTHTQKESTQVSLVMPGSFFESPPAVEPASLSSPFIEDTTGIKQVTGVSELIGLFHGKKESVVVSLADAEKKVRALKNKLKREHLDKKICFYFNEYLRFQEELGGAPVENLNIEGLSQFKFKNSQKGDEWIFFHFIDLDFEMELRRQNTRSELIIRSQEREVFVISAELEIGALEPVDILGFHTGHWLEVLLRLFLAIENKMSSKGVRDELTQSTRVVQQDLDELRRKFSI